MLCDAIPLTASLIQVQKNEPMFRRQSQFFPKTPPPLIGSAESVRGLLFFLSLSSGWLTFLEPTVHKFSVPQLMNDRYQTAFTKGENATQFICFHLMVSMIDVIDSLNVARSH